MTGRKVKASTYFKDYSKYLTNSPDYRMRSFCHNITWTALPIAHIYAHYFGDEEYLIKNISKDMCEYVLNNKLPKKFNKLENYPVSEYAKAYYSYKQGLINNGAKSPLKETYKKYIKKELQKRKEAISQVCKEVKVSQGNLHEFLNGKYNKMSIEKCEILYNYLLKK